ncbi:uncharacterized protein [Ptychodera flava]|uniref:uncharacterized protein n=1 Tax=Ptychodera flava TaxID=63121 RepID=UPI00396A43D6
MVYFIRDLVNIAGTMLNKAIQGMRQLFSDKEYPMKCLALMGETSNTNTFGLAVRCYPSDEKSPETDKNQHLVGEATVGKPLKQGYLSVRLVSECFEADTNAGENRNLEQNEQDFRGREFEKQFACKFKKRPQKNEIFGKVYVERRLSDGTKEDIFNFNLLMYENEEKMTGPGMLKSGTELTDISRYLLLMTPTLDPCSPPSSKSERTAASCHADLMDGIASGKRKWPSSGEPSPGKKMKTTPDSSFRFDEDAVVQFFPGLKTPGNSETVKFFDGNGPYTVVHRGSTPPSENLVLDYTSFPSTPVLLTSTPTHLDPPPAARSTARRDLQMIDADKELTEKNLTFVARSITSEWRGLGHSLGLAERDLCTVEAKHPNDVREQAFQMLYKWREQYPDECTLGNLLKALVELGLICCAREICNTIN